MTGLQPYLADADVTLYHGDALETLRRLPDGCVDMVATSPPFYGLRDYGTGSWEGGDPDCDHTPRASSRSSRPAGGLTGGKTTVDAATITGPVCHCGARRVDRQIGLEETPDEWVARLVAVFRECRRVLADHGTLWVEIGDSYTASGSDWSRWKNGQTHTNGVRNRPHPYKPKDLLGQPWMLAFALRADGWYLRSEIVWARPNPMPESVTDRPTKAHSTVFLLSKQPRYFYDADAIREVAKYGEHHAKYQGTYTRHKVEAMREGGAVNGEQYQQGLTRPAKNPLVANARSVWTIPTEPTPFAHFATWPQALVRRMVLAGTSEKGCCPECGAPWVRWTGEVAVTPGPGTLGWSSSCDHDCDPVPCTVLDPFAGSATTMLVARNHGRHAVGIELNEQYLEIAAKRLQQLSLLTGDVA